MNIFLLDQDFSTCAKYYMDSHINKIPVEINQMLATALSIHSNKVIHRINGNPYKPCFHHHPCTKWVASNRSNFLYACELNLDLCQENNYRNGRRFNGVDATLEAINHSEVIPNDVPSDLYAVAISPDHLKSIYQTGVFTSKEYISLAKKELVPYKLAQKAYRAYYSICKTHLAKWTKRQQPKWYND